MGVLLVCKCVHWSREQKSTGSPGTGVRDGCEHMGAGNGTWSPTRTSSAN